MHDRTRIERCRNAEIGTHILEGKVVEMIREIMLDPGKLRGCIDTAGRLDDQSIARELARIAGEIRALEEERRRLIARYAAEQMAGEAYIAANRALDRDLERLTREKAKLAAALRSPLHEDFVDASVRHFCATANARLQTCTDFDAKRQFLVGHVERVIYNRYKSRSPARFRCNRHRETPSCNFRSRARLIKRRFAHGRKQYFPKMGA
jgi:hypothetical protein